MKIKRKKKHGHKKIKECNLTGTLSVVVSHSERVTGIVRDIDEDFIYMKVRKFTTSKNYIVKSFAIDRLVSILLKKERIEAIGDLIGKKATLQFLPVPTQVDSVKGEVGFLKGDFAYAINANKNHMLVSMSEFATIEAKDPDNGRKKIVKDPKEED